MKFQALSLSRGLTAAVAVAASFAAATPTPAASADIEPSKDNTLYANDGSISNGSGQHLFSGKTDSFGARRSVLAFNVAGAVPAGSTISSVKLNLTITASASSPRMFSLHRLLADWGEGASNAGNPGGAGAIAQPGDATWDYRFYPDTVWSSPGGDFLASESASAEFGGSGSASISSTAALVSDVQGWLDSPGANFGWILIGDESVPHTAYRFESRESTTPSDRPLLSIEYTPPTTPAGSVPDHGSVPGAPLTIVSAGGGDLTLLWSASCVAGDTDYEVYEGEIGDFTSHVPLTCTTGGATSATVTPSPGSHYYLAVPRNGVNEGSYGKDSGGADRPPSLSSCLPQAIATCP